MQFGPVAKAVVVCETHTNSSRRLVAGRAVSVLYLVWLTRPAVDRTRRCVEQRGREFLRKLNVD